MFKLEDDMASLDARKVGHTLSGFYLTYAQGGDVYEIALRTTDLVEARRNAKRAWTNLLRRKSTRNSPEKPFNPWLIERRIHGKVA
jgi:hypothetical protein